MLVLNHSPFLYFCIIAHLSHIFDTQLTFTEVSFLHESFVSTFISWRHSVSL